MSTTEVNVYPKIFITDESMRVKALQALKKAVGNSLIANSSKSVINCQAEIIRDLHPKYV